MILIRRTMFAFGFAVAAGIASVQADQSESMGLLQAMQRVLDVHPHLQIANTRAQAAQYEPARVDGQIGWNLDSSAGVNHDTNFVGTPSDKGTASVNLNKSLSSGGKIGLGLNYQYEDSELTVFPSYPNPSHQTRLDLSYRHPLSRGAGNPDYNENAEIAKARAEIGRLDWEMQRDRIAQDVIELFYGIALTQERIRSSEKSIKRAVKLKNFILGNTRLGLSEKKDVLQADAQLSAQRADQRNLMVLLRQQLTAFNLHTVRPWDLGVHPKLGYEAGPMDESGNVQREVLANNPELKKQTALLGIAESTVAKKDNEKRSKLDFIISVGGRDVRGDSSGGEISETDYAGGLQIEYSRPLDKTSVDASLIQAIHDRMASQMEQKAKEAELVYLSNGLIVEISETARALHSFRSRLKSEQLRYDDAYQRYRSGRIDVSELLRAEADLRFTELSVVQQEIELEKKQASMALMRGTLWKQITPSGMSKETK